MRMNWLTHNIRGINLKQVPSIQWSNYNTSRDCCFQKKIKTTWWCISVLDLIIFWGVNVEIFFTCFICMFMCKKVHCVFFIRYLGSWIVYLTLTNSKYDKSLEMLINAIPWLLEVQGIQGFHVAQEDPENRDTPLRKIQSKADHWGQFQQRIIELLHVKYSRMYSHMVPSL